MTTLSTSVLFCLTELMYIQFQSANMMLAPYSDTGTISTPAVQFPACHSVNHCLELFESHRSQKTWQSLNRGQMGQEGQIRGRVKFTNLPQPQSWTDSPLALAGAGGADGAGFSKTPKTTSPRTPIRGHAPPRHRMVLHGLTGRTLSGKVGCEPRHQNVKHGQGLLEKHWHTQSAEGWGATIIYDLTNQG